MKLKCKKRSQNRWMALYVAVVPLLFAPLLEWFRFPAFIKYTVDAVCCILVVTMIVNQTFCKQPIVRKLEIWILCFFTYSIINYFFKFQSVFYLLWGIRNNFRFYVLFFACTHFLHKEDIEDYFKLLDVLFYVNLMAVAFQYFALGFKQDFLGGIFGTQAGCNAWLNIFQVIIVSLSVLKYIQKKESAKKCMIKCSSCLAAAALAELKFYFVEFIIIILLASLLTKFSWRKLGLICISILIIPVFVNLMLVIFPSMAEVMSIEGFLRSATSEKGYTSAGDINRLTVFSTCKNNFLVTPQLQTFGLGLGNCDLAEGIGFLTTPFYTRYHLCHYMWLSTAFTFLENGYIGLVFYFGFFVLVFIYAEKKAKINAADSVHCQLAQILSIMCIVISVYNSSLRLEAGYMIYITIAIPFIKNNNPQVINHGG